ncbi:Histidine protein kinase; sensor protein [Leuconostoc citreum KM20]|uniref:histidine kinase n=2 Tax=Leuconostoc citreum TaxID=33964 RepID=B1MZY4_LEUCK|nr:Histidine protein kinase; sensor protein [Leuconostoc citreum KM20]
MKKNSLKFLSFLCVNMSVILLFSVLLFHLSVKQWLLLLLAIFLATIGEYAVSLFWNGRRQREIDVMTNRMLATQNNEEPRGVLAEPQSPYYDLINAFNQLQSYVKHMQSTMQRDLANYQSLLTSLPVGVIHVNRRHIIDVFNQTAADLLAVDRPETPIAESLVIRQFALSELITQTFNTQQNQQAILNLAVDNGMKQYEVSTFYQKGDVQHAEVMIILYDLTTVLQIERMQSDFLANASHELKTPLTAITGFIETLQGPAGEDATTRQQFLQIVSDEAQRLSLLVNDILSLSRAQQRDDTLQKELTISDMIVKQWEQIGTLYTDKAITLRNDVPRDFVVHSIYADVNTILQNLLVNAVKYNVQGGSIQVTAFKDHQHWQLNIKDTGIGIPTSQQSRIFERFYRGDESRQRKIANGTGLGLAIVNEIVSKHNGTIKVQSQVGVGTVMSMTMPL